jgi:DNA-binding transcriptional regulator YiaG
LGKLKTSIDARSWKVSQEVLAKKLDVAFSTVNRWLNGKSKPNKIQSYHIEKLLIRTQPNRKEEA